MRSHRLGEAQAEPLEQRVARPVPERVVVLLEAIEVEYGEQQLGVLGRLGERVEQVVRERSAVAQAGQDIGATLVAPRAEENLAFVHEPLDLELRHVPAAQQGGASEQEDCQLDRGGELWSGATHAGQQQHDGRRAHHGDEHAGEGQQRLTVGAQHSDACIGVR